MSTSVKYITSTMRGAPTINGVVGTLIPALDAFLITGWGGVTALSGSVAGGVATLLFSPGDSFEAHSVVLVSGATPGGLNGEARVLSRTNSSITFATAEGDGVITGTIAVKYAPQSSWEKVFSGTNKAVYRSNDLQSNGHYLRVDDTGTNSARVVGYETMTDVDTGLGAFPSETQFAGGGYFRKRSTAGAGAVPWRMFSDERILYLAIASQAGANPTSIHAQLRGFGDLVSLSPAGDAWGTVLSYSGLNDNAAGGNLESQVNSTTQPTSTVAGAALARAYHGLGGSVLCNPKAVSASTPAAISGSDALYGPAPSEVSGRIYTTEIFVSDVGAGKPARLMVPGVRFIPQVGVLGVLNDGDIHIGDGADAGRALLAVACSSSMTAAPGGIFLMDLTGPWR